MAYANSDDLKARYDARTIGDLASDTGVRVEVADFALDTNIIAALADASGEIETALVVARRYKVSDLTGLAGNSLAKLKRITCEIAMACLLGRRPAFDPELLEKFEEKAMKSLDKLAKGENVFNLEDQKGAGLPTIDGPTVRTYTHLNLWRDRTKNFFPARRNPGER